MPIIQPAVSLSADRVNLLLILVAWTAMALLVNPLGDFPLNDDWVYGLAVRSVVESGYYQFPSPSSANVGPQVYWGALFCLPYGFSYTALRISTLAAGFIGVAALYCLIRWCCQNSKIALTGALALAVNPLYFALSNSFMTDVPFLAALIVALFFLVSGLESGSHRGILAGVIFAISSVLIRQLGIVLLLGLAIAYPIRFGLTMRNFAKAAIPAIIGILAHVGYQHWLLHSGRMPQPTVHSNLQHLFSFPGSAWYTRRVAFSAVSYWGLFILPFVILLSRLKMRRLRRRHAGLLLFSIVLLAAGLIRWKGDMPPSVPNIFAKWGIGPLTLRDSYILGLHVPALPAGASAAWDIMGVLALAAGAALLFFLGAMGRTAWRALWDPRLRPGSCLFWLLMVSAAAYFAILLFISGSLQIFDRYFLPFIPLLLILLAHSIPDGALQGRRVFMLPALAIIAYGCFSVAATHDYIEWNRLRWRASAALMAAGDIKPGQIDGGYEFNGLFLYDAGYKSAQRKSWWWVDGDTYLIASGQVPGYSELARYSFRRWYLGSESTVLVLHKN